jgi:hypothetical protein
MGSSRNQTRGHRGWVDQGCDASRGGRAVIGSVLTEFDERPQRRIEGVIGLHGTEQVLDARDGVCGREKVQRVCRKVGIAVVLAGLVDRRRSVGATVGRRTVEGEAKCGDGDAAEPLEDATVGAIRIFDQDVGDVLGRMLSMLSFAFGGDDGSNAI